VGSQKTKFVILGLLSIKPFTGYGIKKAIAQSTSHFWAESNGQLYPTLNRLEKEKLIVLEEKRQKGKKVSHLYSITKEGLSLLEKWLCDTKEIKNVQRDEGMLKLFFGRNASPAACLLLLKKREEKAKDKLSCFIAVKNELEKHSESPHYFYWLLSLKNGMCHAEAELQWVQEAIQTFMRKQIGSST
jgi:DNA-binding PadR family transcriptional regulator